VRRRESGAYAKRFEVPVASLIVFPWACITDARKMKLLVTFSDFSVRWLADERIVEAELIGEDDGFRGPSCSVTAGAAMRGDAWGIVK